MTGELLLQPWHNVELRLPAQPGQPHVLCTVVSSMALRAEFTVDVAADLQLVVEEMYATLVAIAAPMATLHGVFTETDTGLAVHTCTVAEPGVRPPRISSGEHVLAALTDEIYTWQAMSPDHRLVEWHIEAIVHRKAG